MSLQTSTEYQRPQGKTEDALAAIWQEVLGVERVGRDDNFFELGGHSMTGMKLIERIAERLHAHIPVHSVFLHPTVREIAQIVEEQLQENQQPVTSSHPASVSGVV